MVCSFRLAYLSTRGRQRRATDGRLIGERDRYLDGFDAANDWAATLRCSGQQTQAFRYPRGFTDLICTPPLFVAWAKRTCGCHLPTKARSVATGAAAGR